ncbi:hypothetical protein GOBAR_DD28434 [Gossypium barbadense]|nr:hypothetical protein GOBAR_DD28434 [Gossypium barbadense]
MLDSLGSSMRPRTTIIPTQCAGNSHSQDAYKSSLSWIPPRNPPETGQQPERCASLRSSKIGIVDTYQLVYLRPAEKSAVKTSTQNERPVRISKNNSETQAHSQVYSTSRVRGEIEIVPELLSLSSLTTTNQILATRVNTANLPIYTSIPPPYHLPTNHPHNYANPSKHPNHEYMPTFHTYYFPNSKSNYQSTSRE